jgi:hypothetical protein
VQAVAIVPAIAAIYVAVALVAKSLTWYWPSQPGAMANEAALALGALLGGAAFMRFQPKARAAVAAGAAAIYTALSAGGLAIVGPEAPGLGRYRHYVFAPSACEFAVRFPGPPQVQDEAIAVGGGTTATVIARWSDFGALAAWRAECIPAPAGGLGQAEIGVATKDGMAVASLSGRLGGAIIDMSDGPASTRIESRIHGGKSSLMRLTVAQPGRAPLSPQAQAFLDSVTWRDAP